MKSYLNKWGVDLSQPSTRKGLALIGAGVALAVGQPELLTAAISDDGIKYGGVIGTAVPVLLGLWETIK
ncbi:hypothetical protein [Vibrio cincinnatiensis]|uniref:hypothetical protein n=1 Tax=Vibrio cincinnatiensis TaxID=675 RepID=UPI001EDFF0EB|nr:hypothetical protein [Vibrio cincinnatiensis]MCG3728365.1 hypothetical protein [Vibrio cincinnatiensis]